jgi:riboflavin kinase/FMN adenylyltransferase
MGRPGKDLSTVVTIGVFDGVHLGHQKLIKKTVELARRNGWVSTVLTFDPLPEEFFEHKTGIVLTLPEEKKRLLSRLGIEYVMILDFNQQMALLSREEFVEKILLFLNPKAVVVGKDFRFGRGASGDVEFLREALREKAEVQIEELYEVEGKVVKSSLIRELILKGMTIEAGKFLGRRYFVYGEVVQGKGLGRAIRYPTANVRVNPRKLLPAPGVYSGFAEIDLKKYVAAIFVPDSAAIDRTVEAHLLEFDGDLYGKQLLLEFHERVSNIENFSRLEDLQFKIANDIRKVLTSIWLK